MSNRIQLIPREQLVLSKQNMRQSPVKVSESDADTDLTTLANSIRAQGMLNPILVRPVVPGDSLQIYEVYAGRRRLAAAHHLNWERVPCIVSTISDLEAKVQSLVENYQRKENTYKEKVRTFSELYHQVEGVDPAGLSVGNACNFNDNSRITLICQTVGAKSKTIKRYLKLSVLDDSILDLLDLRENGMTLKNAELLTRIEQREHRSLLVKACLESKLSSGETEVAIRLFFANQDPEKLDEYISVTIDRCAKDRQKKIGNNLDEPNSNDEHKDDEDDQDVDEQDGRDEQDDPEAKEHETNEEKVEAKDPTEEVSERVSKKKPWLYDPSDKLKIPKQIDDKHLEVFWKLYEQVNDALLVTQH